MRPFPQKLLIPVTLFGVAFLCSLAIPASPSAGGKATPCWRVEDLRRGMKGHGRTVMKGTTVETFQAEVLGVMKNTSPGRDLVLARLSGLNLEKTGVIAGMSGSPVYIDNKLVGAVAYAWPFGKEPIAGITPFCQMHSFVESFAKHDAEKSHKPVRLGLGEGIEVSGRRFDSVAVAQGFGEPCTDEKSGVLWMAPLQMPLAASGFTKHSLNLLAKRTSRFGLVPMMGGGTTAKVADEEKDVNLEPGGPLAVSLITGDFDLSGIGTTTHIEGNRVYGWGHPFMSLGACQLPMMTGFIHAIYPRQTVSFKMGSPLKEVGVMNADVSTCISGVLGRKADMIPVHMTVALSKGEPRTFNVRIARHRGLMPAMVYTALTNCIDMEGELPEELTARLNVRIELEGREPVVIKDTYSGFSGGRAPGALYGQVASMVSYLTFNPYKTLNIKRIDCDTIIEPGRATAEIEAAELDSDTYCPGDVIRASVFVRPHKGTRQRIRVQLKLPEDLPEGSYTATLCDETASARLDIRGNPSLYSPTNAEQVLESIKVQTAAKRTNLVLRVPIGAHGVTTNGKALPNLPGSMIHILMNSKRTGPTSMTRALVAKHGTDQVIVGSDSIGFRVTKTRKVTRHDD
jgi:hypothetical protein